MSKANCDIMVYWTEYHRAASTPHVSFTHHSKCCYLEIYLFKAWLKHILKHWQTQGI